MSEWERVLWRFGPLAVLGLIGFIIAWRGNARARHAAQVEKPQPANPAATLDALLAIYGDIVRKAAEAERLVRPLLENATTQAGARQSRRPPG